MTHQQLPRSLDALMDHQDEVDAGVAELLRALIDQDLSVVFYDRTTIRTEGLSQQAGDVRQYGMAKQGLIARPFEQDEGVKHRGRKLSDSGAKARFYHAVSEAHLSHIIKVDLGEALFSYHIDDKAKRLAEMMDGKLLLVTNAEGLAAQNVIQRYKSLADIERGFKVLKSEIEIGPVYHRLPERIRAHASICFMALILHRVMRSCLKAADAGYTPERALEQLQRIQHHRVRLNGGEPVAGVSSLSTEQNEVLHALGIAKPAVSEQLALL